VAIEDDPEAALAAMLQEAASAPATSLPAEAAEQAAPAPIAAVVDPALLALVEGRARPEIMREHAITTWVRDLPYHLDPADWRAGFLAVHEGGPPLDIREALREQTPQAHLRDLFRPVFQQGPVPLELHSLPLDPGGREALAELRASLRREPPPQVVRSLAILAERRDEWRAFLATPWRPFLRDDEPRREVHVAIEPSLTR
jgi:hypothetical protein